MANYEFDGRAAIVTPRCHEVRDLLQRNGAFHAFYPVDSEEGQQLLVRSG